MAKSKVTPIHSAIDSRDALYDALAELAEIRAELLCASEVLNDSAFSGGNSITEDRDVSAVLVFRKSVEKLSELQSKLDRIHVSLAQPIGEPKEASNG